MNREISPEAVVQEQLDAYNARDLERFVAVFADEVQCWRLPGTEPFLRGKAALAKHYAENRFNRPALHADVLGRIVMGNKVIDHERIRGVHDTPFEATAIYEVRGGRISAVWFLSPD